MEDGTVALANLTIKGLPDALYERIRDSAQASRRSINSEVIARLEQALGSPRISPDELLARVRAVRSHIGQDTVDGSVPERREERRPALIVVDTNVVAYLLITGAATPAAEAVFARDPVWCAPLLWRSEFCNVLARRIRLEQSTLDVCVDALGAAHSLFEDREFRPSGEHVLSLADESGCSAYDCEFVAVARDLAVSLVTLDREIVKRFPDIAVDARRFAA